MPKSIQRVGFLLLATIGMSLAGFPQDTIDVASRPAQQKPLLQTASASGVAFDPFTTGKWIPNDATPSPALLAGLATWISGNLGMPAVHDQPRVKLVASAELAKLRFGGSLSKQSSQAQIGGEHAAPSNEQSDILGLYDDATRTIYLQSGWTGVSPAELSVLIHEMVHHVQNAAGLQYECAEARERAAFLAQQRWLELFGRSLQGEFSIDPMTLFIRTTCWR